jgi:hypothetical protein
MDFPAKIGQSMNTFLQQRHAIKKDNLMQIQLSVATNCGKIQ